MTTNPRDEYPDSLSAAARALRHLVGAAEERTAREEHILKVASEIGETDPRRLTRFLLTHLVPKCLINDSPASGAGHVRTYRLRELLRDWLDTLPEEALWPVRASVLKRVIAHVNANRSLAGLYCLAAIGYRSTATVRAFRRAGVHNDSNGHEALRLLLGLAPSSADREWTQQRISNTPKEQRTDPWYTAASQFHDTTWIDALVESASSAQHAAIGFARLSWTAEEAPGDLALQDAVWSGIMRAVERRDDGWPALLFTGGLFERCNTPTILATFVRNAAIIQELGGLHIVRWIDRLQDPRTPLQIEGWQDQDRVALERVLLLHVERNSGPEMTSHTIEADTKEKAIDALLCSGNERAVSVATAAIENETNGYTTAEVLNRLASLSVNPIPERVRASVLSSPVIDRSGSSNSPLAIFFAASRFTASSLHIESLRLLLDSKGTSEGHPYRQQVQVAARLASWLWKRGDKRVLDVLLDAADSPSLIAQAVAVHALANALLLGLEDTAVRDRMHAIAGDASRQSYIRKEALVGLLSTNPASQSNPEAFASLLLNSDRDMKRLAFCGLVVHGQLAPYRNECEEFAFAPPIDASDCDGAYVAGVIAALDPTRYSARVADLIQHGTDWTTHGVLSGFRFALPESPRLPADITGSLVRKIHAGETAQRANPDLFFELATLAPQETLGHRWETVWHDWMPDSRVSLADSIPIAAARVAGSGKRAEELLKQLIGDGVFAVRRAAARALSKTDSAALADWCTETLRVAPIALRRFAAEAAAWMPVDSFRTLDNAQLRTAANDPERLVRSAAGRARQARRLRHWSGELLRQVSSPQTDPNDWVLSSYAAGCALGQIGDDADLQRLSEVAEDPETPPNVAHWLTRIADKLEGTWKDRTAKWPESWLPWQGALEQVDGTLGMRGQTLNVRITLWLRRGKPGREPNAWGAAAWVREGQGYSLWFGGGSSGGTLTIPGRPPAEILLVATDGQKMVFTGDSAYPEPPQSSSSEQRD